MRIVGISSENLRRIPDFSVPTGKHLILVGPNDSGKTSIMRWISLTLSGEGLHDKVLLSDFTDASRPIQFDVALGELSPDEEIQFADEIDRTSTRPRLRVRLTSTIDIVDGSVSSERTYPDFDNAVAKLPKLAAIGWSYVPANRSTVRDLTGERGGALRRLLSEVDLEEPEAISEAIMRFREALDSNSSLIQLRVRLATALRTVLSRDISAEDLVFLAGSDLLNDPLNDVTMAVDTGGHFMGLENQSDGLRALSSLAFHSLLNVESKIVGIDEPEIHLHPPAQRGIGQLLSNSGLQQVIATNSAHLLAQFKPSDVIAIDPNRKVRVLPSGCIARSNAFVARWWAEPLIEPLTASTILLVEGVTDRLIVSAVAAKLGIVLDRLGITMYDLDGAKSVNAALELYGSRGFDSRIVGLVDEDHRIAWAGAFGVDPAALETVNVFVCDPSLEGEIIRSLGSTRTLELLVDGGEDEAEIRTWCGCPAGAISDEDLLRRMKRFKIESATAISSSIETHDAENLQSINGLLRNATRRGQ